MLRISDKAKKTLLLKGKFIVSKAVQVKKCYTKKQRSGNNYSCFLKYFIVAFFIPPKINYKMEVLLVFGKPIQLVKQFSHSRLSQFLFKLYTIIGL